MDRKTNKISKKFTAKIKKAFNPEKLILFGSRARGDCFKTSDFDFIIVSDRFKKIPFMLRLSLIYDYWDEKEDIEAICYTSEEFERKKKQAGIVKQALKEGIKLI